MQQSNVIFGMLLLAFIVFITVRGELQTYLTLLRGGGTPNGSSSVGTSSDGSFLGGVDDIIGKAGKMSGASDTMTNAAAHGIIDVFGGV
jgi:hypothetical protein